PGTPGCAPDSVAAVQSPPPAQTECLDAPARQRLAISRVPAVRQRSSIPLHPDATPACSRRTLSALRSPLDCDWPPASLSLHRPAPTTAPAALSSPPVRSCTAL